MGLKERRYFNLIGPGAIEYIQHRLCKQNHCFVNTHLNDNSFQLQQPFVFILSD